MAEKVSRMLPYSHANAAFVKSLKAHYNERDRAREEKDWKSQRRIQKRICQLRTGAYRLNYNDCLGWLKYYKLL